MMNSKLGWTQKIGDAMIAQQSDVAASIQRLRAQAQAAGNLQTTPQQTVTQQPASAGAPAGTPPAIVIQPTNPDTVYVPAYNPELGLWIVALSRLSAVLLPADRLWLGRLLWRRRLECGLQFRPGLRRRRRLLRRLELGRRLGWRLGLGRMGWLGPQQLHHDQRQPGDLHHQQLQPKLLSRRPLEPRSGASPRRALPRSGEPRTLRPASSRCRPAPGLPRPARPRHRRSPRRRQPRHRRARQQRPRRR